jgi:hypothetical protein
MGALILAREEVMFLYCKRDYDQLERDSDSVLLPFIQVEVARVTHF